MNQKEIDIPVYFFKKNSLTCRSNKKKYKYLWLIVEKYAQKRTATWEKSEKNISEPSVKK